MARVYGKNPIDPATGKPKRGRPFKVTPVDTMQGDQPKEVAFGKKPETSKKEPPIRAVPQDPKEQVSTELAELWKQRFEGTPLNDIPPEVKQKYPDGSFCWVRPDSIGQYRNQYGYEPVVTDKALPGQTDTSVSHGGDVLMVRPQWMKDLHDEALAERAQSQLGNPTPARADDREEYAEGRRAGARFTRDEFRSDNPSSPDFLAEKGEDRSNDYRPKGSAGRHSKYVQGGFPK